jgi:hypothetical protein
VVAMGYPLSGLLATGAKLTVGNVSALAGLGDDSRFIQISAPVQPGNSGGPLLDTSGHLVGIVTQKLNVLRVAPLVGGDIAQNVNFALKTQVARTFLDSKGIAYQRAPSEQQLSPADVGEMARPFTVFVECRYKSSSGAATAALPERSPPATNKPSPAPQQSPKVAEESFKKGNTAYAAKNYAEAMRWFRQAADNGSGAAMSSIGQMYRTGQGVSQDYGEAMVWFHKAAGKGIASAMNSIGFMYAMGEGVAQDHRVALHWFRAAAENGDRSAMANVAQLLATGEGGAKDCDAARGWLERAAAAGFEDAKRHLRSGFDGRCLW